MIKNEKKYYSADFFYKKKFGKKVYKVSIDKGFTCPNRDGTISQTGCIFCSSNGSGDFCSNSNLSVTEQIRLGYEKIKLKSSNSLILPYFQAFTNTYAPIEKLTELYHEAISYNDSIGLAIATRPDCLPDNVLTLLDKISYDKFVQVELGLQTVNDETAKIINRGYDLQSFEYNYLRLRKLNVHIVVHLIIGLPGEGIEDYFKAIDYLSYLKADGVKIQMLHMMKNTPLVSYNEKNPIDFMSLEKYVSTVVLLLKRINPEIVIHRLTGDAPWATLIEPKWSTDKRRILNNINKALIDV